MRPHLIQSIADQSAVGRISVIVRYFLDPETGQPHIYDHNVNETEV